MFVTLNNGIIFRVHEFQSVPESHVAFRMYPVILKPGKQLYLSRISNSFAYMDFNDELCRWTSIGFLEKLISMNKTAKTTWKETLCFPSQYPLTVTQVKQNVMAVETMFAEYKRKFGKSLVSNKNAVMS